jgi:Ni,Fe-hydrogenase III component G
MNNEEILTLAEQIVKSWDWKTEVSRSQPNQLDVNILNLEQFVPIVVGLRVKRLGYLSAIVGLDLGREANQLEVLYYFCEQSSMIVLHLRIPRQNARIPSLCEVIPSAEVFERELREMFGIEITGLKTIEYLYLPEDWPDGVFPMRKDADLTMVTAQTGKV